MSGGRAGAGSGAWRAADRPNERTKGQGETGVNSNEPNLADVEEENGGRGGRIGIAKSPQLPRISIGERLNGMIGPSLNARTFCIIPLG